MNKRYTVTSTQTPHGPIYQIEDKVTGAVIESAYKCQIWAEREAERMEKENGHNREQIERATLRARPITKGAVSGD